MSDRPITDRRERLVELLTDALDSMPEMPRVAAPVLTDDISEEAFAETQERARRHALRHLDAHGHRSTAEWLRDPEEMRQRHCPLVAGPCLAPACVFWTGPLNGGQGLCLQVQAMGRRPTTGEG